MTCNGGGDVVLRHNSLRDAFSQFCHRACLGGQLEVGCGIAADKRHSRPADILVQNWITDRKLQDGLQLWQLKLGSMMLMIVSVQSSDGFLYP